MLKFRVVTVRDLGGTVARGLEQSPTLRFLDVSSPHRLAVGSGGGHYPETTF